MFRSSYTTVVLSIAVMAMTVVVTAPSVDAGTHGIRAHIDESFEIQGRIFPPSEIFIQRLSEYNPTLSLNKVWVDGECLGLLVAETSASSTSDDAHVLFFEREESDGHLVLVGYGYRGSEGKNRNQFRVDDRLPALSASGANDSIHGSRAAVQNVRNGG